MPTQVPAEIDSHMKPLNDYLEKDPGACVPFGMIPLDLKFDRGQYGLNWNSTSNKTNLDQININ